MTEHFHLPALRDLGKLADCAPTIVVDSREQTPLKFSRLQSVPGTLQSGDYSVMGLEHLFSVERKSIADLAACCIGQNRERFERELHRLRGFRFKRLLIVGSELEIQQCNYGSRIAPKAVFATLSAFEARYDVPVVFKSSPEFAARQIETWAFWFARESVETVNKIMRHSFVKTRTIKPTPCPHCSNPRDFVVDESQDREVPIFSDYVFCSTCGAVTSRWAYDLEREQGERVRQP